MRTHVSGMGWKFYTALAVLFVLAFVALDPKMDRNPLSKIKRSFVNSTTIALGLTGIDPRTYGQTVPSYAQLAGDLAAKSLSGEFPPLMAALEISVRFKHLKKIQDERNAALVLTILTDSSFYPAKIKFMGEEYKASIRLKGDLTDHWTGPNRWSFRIRLKGGRTILGMSQFSIHKPASRQIPFDNMFEAWMRAVGNVAPRHEYAQIKFNGDNWGVMNVEEHMTKHLLEGNGRKESPIFKIGSEENWTIKRLNKGLKYSGSHAHSHEMSLYNDRKYADDPQQLALFGYGVESYRAMMASNLTADKLFDIDRISRAIIAAAVWQNIHGVHFQNMRLNLNPYTLRLEPVTTDQGNVQSAESSSGLLERRPPFYIGKILRGQAFYDRFDKNLKALKDAVPALREEQAKLCAIFVLDCPAFDFGLFQSNLDKIEAEGSALFADWGALSKPAAKPDPQLLVDYPAMPLQDGASYVQHVLGEYSADGTLKLFSILRHDIVLEDVRLNCKKGAGCKDQVLASGPIDVLAGYDGVFPRITTIRLPKNLWLNRDRFLEIQTRLGDEVIVQKVAMTLPIALANPFLDLAPITNDAARPAFISVEDKLAVVQPGTWLIKAPIRIPAGYRLSIGPATTLRFAPGAFILSEGAIEALGTANAPIQLIADDPNKPWGGIYVAQAEQRSILRHTKIVNTRAFESGLLRLTGAVTFFETDVLLDNVTFDTSGAEDALNTVRSTFEVRDSEFRNARSDAFDTDFSNGHITNAFFEHIGGDGLDTSGSNVTGGALTFIDIFDKAISAGEASTVSLDGVDAYDIGTAAVSKDGSRLEVTRLKSENMELFAAMVYVKKEAYGPAQLILVDTAHEASDIFNQLGNQASLNGQDIAGQDLDVDKLYDAGRMKKIR